VGDEQTVSKTMPESNIHQGDEDLGGPQSHDSIKDNAKVKYTPRRRRPRWPSIARQYQRQCQSRIYTKETKT